MPLGIILALPVHDTLVFRRYSLIRAFMVFGSYGSYPLRHNSPKRGGQPSAAKGNSDHDGWCRKTHSTAQGSGVQRNCSLTLLMEKVAPRHRGIAQAAQTALSTSEQKYVQAEQRALPKE